MRRVVMDTMSNVEMLDLIMNKVRHQHTSPMALEAPPKIDIILYNGQMIDASDVVEVVIAYTEEH